MLQHCTYGFMDNFNTSDRGDSLKNQCDLRTYKEIC